MTLDCPRWPMIMFFRKGALTSSYFINTLEQRSKDNSDYFIKYM